MNKIFSFLVLVCATILWSVPQSNVSAAGVERFLAVVWSNGTARTITVPAQAGNSPVMYIGGLPD